MRLFLPLPLFLFPFLCAVSPCCSEPLPDWQFDSQEVLGVWVPNSHLANFHQAREGLEFEAIGSDPFLHCRGLSIPATPLQFVVLRIRASRPGSLDLFWSGETEGQYGGLTEAKKNSALLKGDGEWEEVPLFPFWHTEGTIRQLRLDLYEGTEFAIDSIAIREWPTQARIDSQTDSWDLGDNLASWQVHPLSDLFLAPPLDFPIEGREWATVRLSSGRGGIAAVVWASGARQGLQSEEFEIRGDGKMRSYPVHLEGNAGWQSPLLAFGLKLPSASAADTVQVESVSIDSQPQGPPEWTVSYFGFENAPNRSGSECRLLACLENIGAETAELTGFDLATPERLEAASSPSPSKKSAGFQEKISLTWTLRAHRPGDFPVHLKVTGLGGPVEATATLSFTAPLDLPKMEYVPPPHPVETGLDVCAYYFPGWEAPKKWDCILDTAPIRKPVLGYYDESNPECVDWQIKWAVENGITCFLVDWYWIQGNQHLLHWFEAYRKSQYRDRLKVAIMWANHNPQGTHSREDWRQVVQHWIERYFTMDSYYHIAGKPAVFLWDPHLIRTDLGSSEEVSSAFLESQQMAREAGHEGIHFVAMHDHDSPPQARRLLSEGYLAATNYHEWGQAPNLADFPGRMKFSDVVATASDTWRKRDLDCGELTYYPVVDTGWDAFPWHGKKAQSISGRTPDLFEDLLSQARSYCLEHDKPLVVLGPVNEWGEGSYIEPCTEYGFAMMERVRRVFAIEPVADWPVNVAPSDVGLGPYDYPEFLNR